MSGDTDGRLVYMVNQIARNFEALGHEHAIEATTDHIISFWDPRMKARILTLATGQGDGLGPIGAAAIARLREGSHPGSQARATVFNRVDESGHSDAG